MAYDPVLALDDLDGLDEAETIEGYFDGRADEPEPSGNRSRSYWHGWRCGMMDAGRIKSDAGHMGLVTAFAKRARATPPAGEQHG